MRSEERKIFLEGLGFVSFRKNSRARRLIIRVKNDGQVKVTIPYLVSLRKAVLFVRKKSDWIIKVQKKLSQRSEERLIFNEQTEFSTTYHKVLIKRYQGKQIRKKLHDGILSVQVPFSVNIESEEVQAKIKMAIVNTWRMEAKEILVKRTHELAEVHKFQFSEIKIKNMRSRWGSCSRKNTICLNLHLLRLPDHLRDYIILHELVHTVCKNHGKEFWVKLNQLTGDAKKLSKELKEINFNFKLD